MRAWALVSALLVACAPVPDPPAHASPRPGIDPMPGGFYPTWEAGLRWRVGTYAVHESVHSMMFNLDVPLPAMTGLFLDLKVERVADDGTVTLISSNISHKYVRFTVNTAGTIIAVDEELSDHLRPPGQPFGHPKRTSGRSGIHVWPVFPLEPGVRESDDGSWTQVVRADGEARIVTIVFADSANGGRCPASVIQRWEPGRPFWSYRVANGCGRAWGHGALISVEDDRLVLQAGVEKITYPDSRAVGQLTR